MNELEKRDNMNTFEQVIILSAELTTNTTKENERVTNLLEDCIKDIKLGYSKAQGFYKGVSENSFVVIVKDNDEIETLKDFAFKTFNQESILHQDANGVAYLVYKSDIAEILGRLRRTTRDDATKQDNYTILKGEYYVTQMI